MGALVRRMEDGVAKSSDKEFTVVAFLTMEDHARVLRYARDFPESRVEQLPPHVTILSGIFTSEDGEEVFRRTKSASSRSGVRDLTLEVDGLMSWHNRKYNGFTVALRIEAAEKLRNLREALVMEMSSIVGESQVAEWESYNPHLTISLSLPRRSAKLTVDRMAPVPSPTVVHTRGLDVLHHGGDFFGYTWVAGVPGSSTSDNCLRLGCLKD